MRLEELQRNAAQCGPRGPGSELYCDRERGHMGFCYDAYEEVYYIYCELAFFDRIYGRAVPNRRDTLEQDR